MCVLQLCLRLFSFEESFFFSRLSSRGVSVLVCSWYFRRSIKSWNVASFLGLHVGSTFSLAVLAIFSTVSFQNIQFMSSSPFLSLHSGDGVQCMICAVFVFRQNTTSGQSGAASRGGLRIHGRDVHHVYKDTHTSLSRLFHLVCFHFHRILISVLAQDEAIFRVQACQTFRSTRTPHVRSSCCCAELDCVEYMTVNRVVRHWVVLLTQVLWSIPNFHMLRAQRTVFFDGVTRELRGGASGITALERGHEKSSDKR